MQIFKRLCILFIFLLGIEWGHAQTQIGDIIKGSNALNLGQAVSLSADGSVLAIGALDFGNNRTGKVLVYSNTNGTWKLFGEFVGEDTLDDFGYSVSVSGNGLTIAIGAPQLFKDSSTGYVQVFDFDGSTWTQKGNTLLGQEKFGKFGTSIDLDSEGKNLVIGSPGFQNARGLVQTYAFKSTVWEKLGQDIIGIAGGEYTGLSVSISDEGSQIAASAPWYSGGKGRVFVMNYSDSIWKMSGSMLVGNLNFENFGSSLSLAKVSGYLAVGSKNNSHYAINGGVVTVYQLIDSTWTILGDSIFGNEAGANFGSSVELSDLGGEMAISSYGAREVQVYVLSDNHWIQVGKTLDSIGVSGGHAISISGDGKRLSVSSPFEPLGGINSGMIMVFELNSILSLDKLFFDDHLVEIFPNPTNSTFTICVTSDIEQLQIFSLLGDLVYQADFETNHRVERIEIADLDQGIYFVQVRIGNNYISKKVIVI